MITLFKLNMPLPIQSRKGRAVIFDDSFGRLF